MSAERTAPDGDWPAAGLERVEACPVCGGTKRPVMFEDLRDRIFFCAAGRWTMYRCGRCASGYLDPRPTPEAIGKAYEDYYTHHAAEAVAAHKLTTVLRIRRALANGYRNWRFGTELRPSSKLGPIAATAIPGMRRLLDRQFRHLPRSQCGRVLDVGCGDGSFLRNAADMGWTAVGTDTDPLVVSNARKAGLDVRQGTIEEVDGPFDAITISHVIEHVHDPVGVIRSCFARLAPGGTLWIETPNIDALGLRRFGPDWRGLEPPRHLVLFSRGALERVLRDAGFVQVADLPQPSVVAGLYAMSENIRRRREPTAPLELPLVTRLEIARASLAERYKPGIHEFLAVIATKGGS